MTSTPTPTSDAALYAAWADGERRAGERLIDRHLVAVARFFANKTGASADADDLVATTFERVADKLGRWERRSSFRTYLMGIAINVWREGAPAPTPVHELG